MNISFKIILIIMTLSVISSKLLARNCPSIPMVKISEHMNQDLIWEILYYAKELGIDDSSTIHVRYSTRMPRMKNGLIQYQNTGFGKERHQVVIWINRRLTSSAQSMTLAHEMVHAAQYILGTLRINEKEAIWHNENFDVGRIRYDDRPWEKEAVSKSYKLRLRYLSEEEIIQKVDLMSVHPYFGEVM